ncbi:hypothetical protein ACP70R_021968 [Stipagrostis hirtigluma subsp. patula]
MRIGFPEKDQPAEATPAAEKERPEATPPAEKKPSVETMPSTAKKLPRDIWSREPATEIGWPYDRYIRDKARRQERQNPVSDDVLFLGVPDPDGAVLLVVLVSVLYALLTPWLLWLVAGRPVAFVWTASLLACSYFLIGTISLSETMGFSDVFLQISHVALLADAAAHLIGPVTGAAVASFATFYGVWMLGYAVGEYLQRVGAERAAAVVASLPYGDEDHERRKEAWLFYAWFAQGTMSSFVVARMAWVAVFPASVVLLPSDNGDRAEEALFVVQELAMETFFVALFWSQVVALVMLEGALVSMETMIFRAMGFYAVSCLLGVVVSHAVSNAAGLVVFWAMAAAMVGFLGYCHAVHARCKLYRIRPTKRNQPVSTRSSFFPRNKLTWLSALLPNKVLDEPDLKAVCSLSQELDDHNQNF